MKKKQAIAITGIGPLTAGGSGNDKVWDAIVNRRTGLVKKEYKIGGDNLGQFYVHEISDFTIDDYDINRKLLNEVETWKEKEEIIDFYYFLATIKMAMDDGGFVINRKNKDTTGLILVHENMGLDHFYRKVINELSYVDSDNERPKTKKNFLNEFYKKFHRTGYELQTFMSLHHIAKIFDIHGFSLFINNACASGLYALEVAADAIKSGKCDRMIVAAVDKSSIFKHIWFNNINMCAKDGRIKPFASDGDGFTIGDGGAALLLEKSESATERKVHVYAEYVGGNFVLEGWKVTYPDVTSDLYKNMIEKAIKVSGLHVSDVDLIVPHGVGANITDRHEAKAICDLFGKKVKRPVVTALKPYIGHTLGSTALLETAIMLLGLRNKKIPPTLNAKPTDPKLDILLAKEMIDACKTRIAVKAACGFAGFNGACVFCLS